MAVADSKSGIDEPSIILGTLKTGRLESTTPRVLSDVGAQWQIDFRNENDELTAALLFNYTA